MKEKTSLGSKILSLCFAVLSVFWLIPVFLTLINSFKSNNFVNLEAFAMPNAESFVGLANYIKGMTFGDYPFIKAAGFSFMITIASVLLILLFCSMTAWYIVRVKSKFANFFYYLCLFSMIVPFQMVMFTLTFTADNLKLNTPYTIPIIYLGFGAGLAIFMFTGFVKGLPLEIEEAAVIDGCGPIRTFFLVVLPMLKPTLISVGILQTMWVWNDYLLPYLVLDRTKFMTIPILVQYLKGSYGTVDLGATMAVIMMSIIPIIILYLFCQKYIVSGVMAGAVKGGHVVVDERHAVMQATLDIHASVLLDQGVAVNEPTDLGGRLVNVRPSLGEHQLAYPALLQLHPAVADSLPSRLESQPGKDRRDKIQIKSQRDQKHDCVFYVHDDGIHHKTPFCVG